MSRTEPMSSDSAARTLPSALPRISSVDPPPMSITRNGSGQRRQGPASRRRSSPAPPRRRRAPPGSTPVRSRMPPRNSSEFSASRAAEVAQNRIALTSCSFTSSMYSSTAVKTRCSEASAIRPVRSTPWPRRTMRMSRTRSALVPASTSRSATSSRSELVPQSKAATRVMRGPPASVVEERASASVSKPRDPVVSRRARSSTTAGIDARSGSPPLARARRAPRRRAGSPHAPGPATGRRARAGT